MEPQGESRDALTSPKCILLHLPLCDTIDYHFKSTSMSTIWISSTDQLGTGNYWTWRVESSKVQDGTSFLLSWAPLSILHPVYNLTMIVEWPVLVTLERLISSNEWIYWSLGSWSNFLLFKTVMVSMRERDGVKGINLTYPLHGRKRMIWQSCYARSKGLVLKPASNL